MTLHPFFVENNHNQAILPILLIGLALFTTIILISVYEAINKYVEEKKMKNAMKAKILEKEKNAVYVGIFDVYDNEIENVKFNDCDTDNVYVNQVILLN